MVNISEQMYKVFFNGRTITISPPGNITLNQPTPVRVHPGTAKEVSDWFQSFLKNKEKEALFIHPESLRFFKLFQTAFYNVYAAGGIVVHNKQMLFIYKNNKWDLPKGKIDTHEVPEEAALREVSEECGISGHKIVKSLPVTYHIYQSPWEETRGQWMLKHTYWFEMSYSGKKQGMPELDEGITKVEWIPFSGLNRIKTNTYDNLKNIIRLFSPDF